MKNDPFEQFNVPQEVEVKQAPLLVNRKKPYEQYGYGGKVKQERPAHRLFLELAARGYSIKEISEQTGYSAVCINNILRQPNTQQVLVNEIREVADQDNEVVELIRDSVVDAVKTIVSIRDDPKTPQAIRLAASNDLLNRRYGKPNQPVNRETGVDLNALSIAELAAKLPLSTTNGTGTQQP
jgi:lambda repressor-like predicted transcriptional regulator